MQNIFKPTKEQERFYSFLVNRNENILIKAYAGSGKTFTIIEGLKYLPKDKSITYLAFNKHIKEELSSKLPEHVRCSTVYGLGLAALKKVYKDIEFDEFKIDKIIQKKARSWDLNSEFKSQEEKNRYLNNIKKLVNLSRLTLTLKPKYVEYLAEKHDIKLRDNTDVKRVLKIMDTCMVDRTYYDHTDMVFLPAIDSKIWFFPQDYVIVDECQDTNICQIKVIQKALKKDRKTKKILGRLIAVGDPYQNIYAFNGSGEKSFNWFIENPNTKVLTLSTSFRCSKNVIKHAQKIVPDIKALDNAPDGLVRTDGDVVNEAQSGDFVLCRTVAPLMKLFFELLLKGKKVIIKGSDIGLGLIELIGQYKTIQELSAHWGGEITKFKMELKNKGIIDPSEHSGFVILNDKVSTLLFLCSLSDNIGDLKAKISMIFSDEIQGIVLSTIHKVKGLEADRVFIIRPDLMPMPHAKGGWQLREEKNLEYVAITRAKIELIYDTEWSDIEK